MTTQIKCKCKTKKDCTCHQPNHHELYNEIPVTGQVVLSYAGNTLSDCIDRLQYFGIDASKNKDICYVFKVFAF